MDDEAFQLVLSRLENQDKALNRIESKLDGINGRVRKNERDITFAKGMGYVAMGMGSAFWAVWAWLTAGGK